MLRTLTIRDFVIVERTTLEFPAGFTVLTGETGAGKSILIDALAVVLGERGDATLVRAGAKQAEVAAEFDLTGVPKACAWLAEAGLEAEEGGCLLRRVVEAGGRSRAFINGRPATVAQLRELGEHLVDIHGQHAHQSLLRPAMQRELVDAYGGLREEAAAVTAAYGVWRDRERERVEAEARARTAAQDRERLAAEVSELTALDVKADEWESLGAEHGRLAHAADLIEASGEALEVLSEADSAVLAQLGAVITRFERLVAHDPGLREILDLLATARIDVQEAVSAIGHYRDRLDLDPQRLVQVERRIEAVHAAARKFRTAAADLPALLEEARARLAALDHEADLDRLRDEEAQARARYVDRGAVLTAGRRRASARLAKQVTQALQTLALAGARFEVALEAIAQGSADGFERIELRIATHPEGQPGPLAKVASGGELSRVSLAIQTVLARIAAVPTLVFDEVDAGIGGGVAEIVGRMLRSLGRSHQVMCVTHLAQVAACADQQWRVEKAAVGGRATSVVQPLDSPSREQEIARMLGGLSITEATRRHAAEMLRQAATR